MTLIFISIISYYPFVDRIQDQAIQELCSDITVCNMSGVLRNLLVLEKNDPPPVPKLFQQDDNSFS